MTDNKDPPLEEKLKEAWKKVRKFYNYPALPEPQLVNEIEDQNTACLDLVTKRIYNSKTFIAELKEKGMSEEDIFDGILKHEVGHYMLKYYPWDMSTYMLQKYEVCKITEEKLKVAPIAEQITGLFDDLGVNTFLLLKKRDESVAKVIQKSFEKDSALGKLICAYYQEQSGYDFGITIDGKLKSQLDEMNKIDFLNKEEILRNIKYFAVLVRDMIQLENPPRTEKIDMQNISKDAEKILKEIAQQSENPEKFEEIIKAYDLEQSNTDNKILYYKMLAENYALKLRKKSLKAGTLFPHSLKEFEIGDSLEDYDVFNSYGEIIPGISKKWNKKQSFHYGKNKETPNAVIALDSSGSMMDPKFNLSYAALGAFCAANTYLLNKSKVAVFNFCDFTYLEAYNRGFQTNQDQIQKDLLHYSYGGTNPDLKLLESLIASSDKPCDLLFISDGFIGATNELLKEVFTYIKKIKNRNRVIFIYTQDNGFIGELKNEFQDDYFSMYRCIQEEDIPKIILGEVNKNFS